MVPGARAKSRAAQNAKGSGNAPCQPSARAIRATEVLSPSASQSARANVSCRAAFTRRASVAPHVVKAATS